MSGQPDGTMLRRGSWDSSEMRPRFREDKNVCRVHLGDLQARCQRPPRIRRRRNPCVWSVFCLSAVRPPSKSHSENAHQCAFMHTDVPNCTPSPEREQRTATPRRTLKPSERSSLTAPCIACVSSVLQSAGMGSDCRSPLHPPRWARGTWWPEPRNRIAPTMRPTYRNLVGAGTLRHHRPLTVQAREKRTRRTR